MNEVRYVFDTNVMISALLFENGKPAQSLRFALSNGRLLLSLELLEELNEVLGRERFNRYVTREEREEQKRRIPIPRHLVVVLVDNLRGCELDQHPSRL